MRGRSLVAVRAPRRRVAGRLALLAGVLAMAVMPATLASADELGPQALATSPSAAAVGQPVTIIGASWQQDSLPTLFQEWAARNALYSGAVREADRCVGEVIAEWDQPSGLHIRRVRTPLGVIGERSALKKNLP